MKKETEWGRLLHREETLALPRVYSQDCSIYTFPRGSRRPRHTLPCRPPPCASSVQALGPDLIDSDQTSGVSQKTKHSAHDHLTVIPTMADADRSVKPWVRDDRDSLCHPVGQSLAWSLALRLQ